METSRFDGRWLRIDLSQLGLGLCNLLAKRTPAHIEVKALQGATGLEMINRKVPDRMGNCAPRQWQ